MKAVSNRTIGLETVGLSEFIKDALQSTDSSGTVEALVEVVEKQSELIGSLIDFLVDAKVMPFDVAQAMIPLGFYLSEVPSD